MKHPVTLEGTQVIISEPEYEWERQDNALNKGAAVLIRNRRIFIAYSANATGHT